MGLSVRREQNKLRIEVPLERPTSSKSGKSLVIASSRGVFMTDVRYKGKPVAIVLNAFIYRDREPRKSQSETES
jgi:hypothetical protein